MSDILFQRQAQRRLVVQAERLLLEVRKAQAASRWENQRYSRLDALCCRCEERVSRRLDHYQRMLAGLPVVTVPQVRQWMAAHLDDYRRVDGVNWAEIAEAACDALDLWDKHGKIPLWVMACGACSN